MDASVNRPGRAATLASLIGLIVFGAMSLSPSAQQPSGGNKVRLNPQIARLEQGQPSMMGEDWQFIDLEHNPYSTARLETILLELGKKKKANGQFELAPVVRIPTEGDEPFRWVVKQAL